jgi:hypothetical protein
MMREQQLAPAALLNLWGDVSPGSYWLGLASSKLREQQIMSLREEQTEVLAEAQKVFDKWCARQQQTVQSAWDLFKELNCNPAGSERLAAWMHWYGGILQQLAEDASDQLAFGSKAAKWLSVGIPGGLGACANSEPRVDKSEGSLLSSTAHDRAV